MKQLQVIAPAEQVKAIRQLATKQHKMLAWQDKKYLHLKWGLCEGLFGAAKAQLPEGSFEIYRSKCYNSGGGYWRNTPDAIRIRTK